MFRRLKLLTKVFVVFVPLLFVAVASSVYFDYLYQQRQVLDQVKSAAGVQATIVKEALVNMMVNNLRVDDNFLSQISKVGDVQNLHILFMMDGLHLRDELISPERIDRLKNRQERIQIFITAFGRDSFRSGKPMWTISCMEGRHADFDLESPGAGQTPQISNCDELRVVLPIAAEQKCQRCHDVQIGQMLGAAYMEIPLERAANALGSNAARMTAIFSVFMVVGVGVGTFIFRNFVSRPVDYLVQATQKLAGGNFDHKFTADLGSAELNTLAKSFQEMQQQLKKARMELIEKERLAATEQVANTIMRDFGDPLTNISNIMQNLPRGPMMPGQQQAKLYDSIHASVEQVKKRTREILEFSQGDIRLELRPWSLTEFVNTIKANMRTVLDKKNIRFMALQGYSGTVTMDKDRMERVIMGILKNGEEAMPNGGELKLEVLDEGAMMTFRISDTGQGIPVEAQENIFRPFMTIKKSRGTSLSLALSKKIVERHGGTIGFNSTPGKGTTFTVKLPI